MKTHLRLLFLLTFLQFSCETKKLLDNKPIAEAIISEVKGTGGDLYFTESENTQTGIKTHYIELNVDSSKLTLNPKAKYFTASYCATQLFKRLDAETIKNNKAINIIFDKNEDLENRKKYFFEYRELADVWEAFENINKYINSLVSSDKLNALVQIDTNSAQLNWSDLNKRIKAKIGNPIKISHFYEHYEQTNKDGSKKFQCYSISTTVLRQDSVQVSIGFLVPCFVENKKIINITKRLERNTAANIG
jgi:hypothetical protein